MCSLPRRFAENGGHARALDAGLRTRIPISRRPLAARRTLAGHEPYLDLRPRPDRACANSVRAKTFSRRRSEEHTSELQSRFDLVCRLLLEKKNIISMYLFTTWEISCDGVDFTMAWVD